MPDTNHLILSTEIIQALCSCVDETLLPFYRSFGAVQVKDDKSPVTQADQAVERQLRTCIEQYFPDHGIIGEEFDAVRPNSPYQWFIDPIDGTLSFMAGRPTFGTLLALTYEGEALFGMIYQPITKDCWVATKAGATHNGVPIRTRVCEALSQAIICTTGPHYFSQSEKTSFDKIATQAQYQLYGGDCYNYGLLASGYVDVVMEAGLKPHDYMAMIALIEQAGGVITDWQGNPLTPHSNGTVLACGDEALHRKILAKSL
jgi:inositol-phosphate phosphatase/L-galactose 1-phosphate phosphatase/histidinol-phosphatase